MSNLSAGRLYRILDFSRAVQIFESESLFFARPATWEDPYETPVLHQSSHALFAQCWCQLGVSDAMWRIYSPHHMGVRISTSTKKLAAAVQASTRKLGYGWKAGPVAYKTQYVLNQEVQAIAKQLKRKFDLAKAVEMLYLKRDAFAHESEWRATLYCPDADPRDEEPGIAVGVNPHTFIDSILLDPRAPQELVDAFTYYFKEKLKFKGRVSRSVLYKSPQRIQLVD